MDAEKRRELEEESRNNMERLSAELIDLILTQPPEDLLGYIWSKLLTGATLLEEDSTHQKNEQLREVQFILEYIHAALAVRTEAPVSDLNEEVCGQIFKKADELFRATMMYCMMTTMSGDGGVFGQETQEVEFLAKSNWVLIRGHRYQVLEGEFYTYVLQPHDEALKATYGIGAADIATGFQEISDSMRMGHMRAYEKIKSAMESTGDLLQEDITSPDQIRAEWREKNPEHVIAAADAFDDLFKGGICNVGKHSRLPPRLLDDLSFQRGEETDFLAAGPLRGTPLRALPVRKKPLVRHNGAYFAVDPSFVRDSGYRALLWNLLQRNETYKQEFEKRQKEMTENAFADILSDQLRQAKVYREIWYKDPTTREWVENDILILIDDVLLQIEAKAGAAATIASPTTDFDRHVRSVQDLVIKAYTQCKRFLEYLNSSGEVPLFKRENDRYVEFTKIRLKDYRKVFPIGLTVESFSPFSAMCKDLPAVTPILGRYPFISVSIDDLFVLRRLFPSAGQFLHYLEVRQAVGGIKHARLYDEIDHAGAYIAKNRFDLTMQEQFAEGANMLTWDGFCEKIDSHFSQFDWQDRRPPHQEMPGELLDFLAALGRTAEAGWLNIDSHLRNFSSMGRDGFASSLQRCLPNLSTQTGTWFLLGESPPLFIWLQRMGSLADIAAIQTKAKAAAVANGASKIDVVLAFVQPDGGFSRVVKLNVSVPKEGDVEHNRLLEEASRMRSRRIYLEKPEVRRVQKKTGPNSPCWCGSGKKLKKCHRA